MSEEELTIPAERLGARFHEDGATPGRGNCDFLVWAPFADTVDLCLMSPDLRTIPMAAKGEGYFFQTVESIASDALYQFRLSYDPARRKGPETLLRADPAARLQPRGVHGPSQIVPDHFAWSDDAWRGIPLEAYIIYEVHVGTASAGGTFNELIASLPALKEMGISAVELMPVAEFPGDRNWGYDGVYPFAAHHAYGGPQGLKQLVNACHRTGLAVILDVVYNHLGPEGNYLDSFGPYFTDAYTTPWGRAVNFDGPYSDPVRRFFLENARYWIAECHVDALRVDAVHGIYDFSARPFLAELTRLVEDEAQKNRRRIYCIAESDLNDIKVLRPRDSGGWAFQAQWSDDFHHALHALLTGENEGYYSDFGKTADLACALEENFVYSGRYSHFRRRCHGNYAGDQAPHRFVVFSQNHDQIGNRMQGDRLSRLAGFEQLKLAAAAVLLSPFIPLLFMGEEYAEPTPFNYFISHGDPDLIAAVRQGRREEFRAFEWSGHPPDPQAQATFDQSKLNPDLRKVPGRHAVMYAFYGELISLRRSIAALSHLDRDGMTVTCDEENRLICVQRSHAASRVCLMFHFSDRPLDRTDLDFQGPWRKRLDTAAIHWLGPGSSVPDTLSDPSERSFPMQPWQLILWEGADGAPP